MIAVDTNILVYAHRTDAPFHSIARTLIDGLAQGAGAWAIPWPCAHEFLAVVTNVRIFKTPTPIDRAFAQLRALANSPGLVFLAESDGYLERLAKVASSAKSRGGAIHDARVAAICLHHGASELWSADRDFSRFPDLRTRNPLAD
ncbi:MAG: PIN domain-containing protein [Burkholderiaceae bacterium]|nr:PIN domain-containing protein [Burkholderiaceae bacterium]